MWSAFTYYIISRLYIYCIVQLPNYSASKLSSNKSFSVICMPFQYFSVFYQKLHYSIILAKSSDFQYFQNFTSSYLCVYNDKSVCILGGYVITSGETIKTHHAGAHNEIRRERGGAGHDHTTHASRVTNFSTLNTVQVQLVAFALLEA